MKNKIIASLEKNKIASDAKSVTNTSSDCCDGIPTLNENACRKLDEEKKAEGKEGCGCEVAPANKEKTSCC
jgi:hypothetical protein